MGRTPREDFVPLMVAVARRKLEAGDEVRISEVAAELDVSPSLVNFYFGDRQSLIDAAWKDILEAHVDDDQDVVAGTIAAADWDGLRALVHEVFTADRDAVRLNHTRATVEARRSDELAALIREVHEQTIEGWANLLGLAVSAGIARTDLDHEAVARLVVAVPMGVTLVSPDLTDEQRTAVADAWFAMLRAVLDPDHPM